MSGAVLEKARPRHRKHDPHPSAIPLLAGLYQRQLALTPDEDCYLSSHSRPGVILNQVRTFNAYLPYLPPRGKVLDWGCNHAPDSCLLRAVCGSRFDLHGCDFASPGYFAPFHEYARLQYRQLTDPLVLPYGDCTFDAVIGSGVLEHTALDYEALKNVYRVLKPDGVFIITYLPNWLSFAEWKRRTIWRKDFHRRLYGKGEIKQLLKRTGFYPSFVGGHTFFWDRKLALLGLGRWSGPVSAFLHRVLPAHWFCSALWTAARKVTVM
jgi:SAM-dependent methyltransferase